MGGKPASERNDARWAERRSVGGAYLRLQTKLTGQDSALWEELISVGGNYDLRADP